MCVIFSPFTRRWLGGLVALCVFPLLLPAQSLSWEGKWTAGVRMGVSQISGDVQSQWSNLQIGGFAQKSVLRYVDVRLQFLAGWNTGQDLQPTRGFQFNPAWNSMRDSVLFYNSGDEVVPNYQTQYQNAGVLFKFNVNQWFRKQGFETWSLYGLIGLGGMLYRTRINAISEADGVLYDYSSLNPVFEGGDEQAIKDALDELQDDTYETTGQQPDFTPTRLGQSVLKLTLLTGGGLSVQLSERFRMGLELNLILTGDDLLDGQQWNPDNTISDSRDRIMGLSLIGEYVF